MCIIYIFRLLVVVLNIQTSLQTLRLSKILVHPDRVHVTCVVTTMLALPAPSQDTAKIYLNVVSVILL